MGRGLAAAAVACLTAATVATGSGAAYGATGSSYLGILNQERATRGLAPLQMNGALTSVAQQWAAEMAASGWLRHNPQLETEVGNWQSLGENVGDGADLGNLAQAFWASPTHRANILDASYTQVGIAAVRSGPRLWIAVVFRRPMQQSTQTVQPRETSGVVEHAWPGRLLTVGTTGSAVSFVQRALGVSADGIFGAETEGAVLSFQRRQQLSADGIVGPQTWAALIRAHT